MSWQDSYQDVDFWEGEADRAESAAMAARERVLSVHDITSRLEASGASSVWIRLAPSGAVSCTLSAPVDRMDGVRVVLNEACCRHGFHAGSSTFYPKHEATP